MAPRAPILPSTLARLLALVGHEVAVAHDGPGALAKATSTRPELVFIDIGLPGMDGYALATALRGAGFASATLVAVTGYGRSDDVLRSRERGFDHHLVKPVDLAALGRHRGPPRRIASEEAIRLPRVERARVQLRQADLGRHRPP